MKCPACGHEQADGRIDCERCQVVFAKLARHSQAAARREAEAALTAGLDREALIHIGAGAAVAVVCVLVPFLNHIFSYFAVLVHELGHTLFMWLFGYPAFPAFDFVYGGGVAIHQDRSWFLVALVYGALGFLGYLLRRNPRGLVFTGAVVALYTLLVLTPSHRHLIGFMGHGTELIIAGIFLYRALSGASIVNPMERPLYATIGVFLTLKCLQFSWQLMFDRGFLWVYKEGKGPILNDFHRLALDFGVEISSVALLFGLLSLLPPLLAYGYLRFKTPVDGFLYRLLAFGGE